MSSSKLPFIFLFAVLFLFNFLIFLVPYLASIGDPGSDSYYAAFGPTCHQLISRSLCLFKSKTDGGYSIGDCMQSAAFSSSRVNEAEYADRTGYKIPVCARDVAIYLSMLIGLLILPFMRKMESDEWPSKWLLFAAAVPIGIDGTGQLIGLWESTNLMRLITGAIIGVALPFYILPVLNMLYGAITDKLQTKKGGQKKSR